MVTGLIQIVSGFAGVVGFFPSLYWPSSGCGIDTTPYGENIGAIGMTKEKTGPLLVWKLLC